MIVTKLDGDARGGVALSVRTVVGKPIVFASVGERLADLDLFYPDRMASRILGMGDVLTLIEQAERTMDADVVQSTAERMMGGQFTLDDFLAQLTQVRKMGSLGGLMRLMPGMNQDMREAADQLDDREVDRIEAIVRSMTRGSAHDPTIVDGSRRQRIATGLGDHRRAGQPAAEAVQGDAEDDARDGERRDAGPAGHGRHERQARACRGAAACPRATCPRSSRRSRAPAPPGGPLAAPRATPARSGSKKKKGGRVTPPKHR